MGGHWACQACGWSPIQATSIQGLTEHLLASWGPLAALSVQCGCIQCGGAIFQWQPDGDLVVVDGKVFNAMDYPGLTPEERIGAAIAAARRGDAP